MSNNLNNLNILAIDTSTNFLSVALLANQQFYLFHQEVANKQSALIIPTIQSLLSQANIQVSDLNKIIYAKGAGAFTGLRIGLGVAQGMATPFDIPLIGVPCLDAVAYQVPDSECVLAATDARMGEVFYAFFDTKNHIRLSSYQVDNINNINLNNINIKQNQIVNLIGNAFELYNINHLNHLNINHYNINININMNMPTAQDYLNLALSGRYPEIHAQDAELLYVRDKIALTAEEQKQKNNK